MLSLRNARLASCSFPTVSERFSTSRELLLGHFVVRTLMHEAARTADADPDWLSFTGCFQILRCRLPECNGHNTKQLQDGIERYYGR